MVQMIERSDPPETDYFIIDELNKALYNMIKVIRYIYPTALFSDDVKDHLSQCLDRFDELGQYMETVKNDIYKDTITMEGDGDERRRL